MLDKVACFQLRNAPYYCSRQEPRTGTDKVVNQSYEHRRYLLMLAAEKNEASRLTRYVLLVNGTAFNLN